MPRILLLLLMAMFICGCADINPSYIAQSAMRPFNGEDDLRVGFTKDEVKARWGTPDNVKRLADGQFGAIREEWYYSDWVGGSPLNYCAKTKRLYFEDGVLVKWEPKKELFKKAADNK